jgi:adenosylcobyric acid synthase
MKARAVMVLGCTSGAGKSWLATALCRWYGRRGCRVAPFKAQNMSNHARLAALVDGGVGEMGSAQYFQARAAGVVPDVRMNPVLLKPEADTRSQVVLLGRVQDDLSRRPWLERAPLLWQAARSAYLSLQSEYDLIVIEGAGSPAETNLAAVDYVNTGTAKLSEASCLLVADIDRGGAFAHLFGTYRLMDSVVRQQVRGFVLNRFRGDPTLLAPGPEDLQALTGVPTLAVVPMVRDHGLPEEDAVPDNSPMGAGPHVVVVAAPHASNLDEFEPLRIAGARLTFSHDAAAIAQADWLILPGSKQTRADLNWLQHRGLADAILGHIAADRPTLAVCGGLQILGQRLEDPDACDGPLPGTEAGLSVLPLVTRFAKQKRLSRSRAQFGQLEGAWATLSNLTVDGYEIHLGRTQSDTSLLQTGMHTALVGETTGDVIGWQCGSVLGVYLHGLFENPAVLTALLGCSPRSVEPDFDRLADVIERSFVPGALEALARPRELAAASS